MLDFHGIKPDSEVIGVLVRKLTDQNRLQEAMSLLDEAADYSLIIRERYVPCISAYNS